MHLIYGIIGTTSCSRIGDTKNPASILILLHNSINLEQLEKIQQVLQVERLEKTSNQNTEFNLFCDNCE